MSRDNPTSVCTEWALPRRVSSPSCEQALRRPGFPALRSHGTPGAGTPALSLAQTITLHVTARLCDDVVDDVGCRFVTPPFACPCGAGANRLADRRRVSLSFAGRGGGCLLGQAWLGSGPIGWDLGAGARRRGDEQVDAVARGEREDRVGIAQRVVVQDRDRGPAGRPGGLAQCVADGGRAGADGDLHDLVAV